MDGSTKISRLIIILLMPIAVLGTLGDQELSVDGAKLIWNNNSQTFSISASGSMSESVDYIWPPADGAAGQAIITNGSGVLTFTAPSTSFTHDVLSVTHSDTVANAVTRGSIIYGNSTPKWDELVISTGFLKGDGTDVAWRSIANTADDLEGSIDHGNLEGSSLTDDDHTLYSLADGTRDFSGVVVGVFPTAAAHLTTKEYVDSAITFVEEYFFNDTASNIGGIYFKMLDTPTGEGESTFTIAGLGTGDDQALTNFATDPGAPGVFTLEKGVYEGHIHAEKTVGTKPVKMHFEVYSRATDTTETLIATSEESAFITSKTQVDVHATLTADVTIATTDRVIVKWLANVDATGSAVTIVLYAEGTNSSRLKVPISSNVLNQIYIRQDGTKELTANWDAGSFDIRAQTLTADALTQGSVLFAGASGVISQDNDKIFWDATNFRLGIGTNTLDAMLDILCSAETGVREKCFEIQVSDASRDFFSVSNRTNVNGKFIPQFAGTVESDPSLPGLTFVGSTNVSSDTGGEPLVQFLAKTHNDGEDYLQPISNFNDPTARDLFWFGNALKPDIIQIGKDGRLNFESLVDNDFIFIIRGVNTSAEILGLGIQSGEAIITAGYIGSGDNALVFKTSATTEAERMRIDKDGNVGIGETAPETLTEWTGSAPILTIHRDTHDDADNASAGKVIFKREDGAGTETAAGQIEISHDGAGANDQLTKLMLSVNTGAGLVEGMRIDSNLGITFAGALAGAWDMGSQALTNVNIDSGVITGITDLTITDGGTGQSTAQAAIDALTQVSGATNEHVLTKDTGTGNATWKVTTAAGGDEKVKIDAAAAAGYIGAANSDGVLRAGTSLSYADGGDFITLNAIQDIQTSASPTFAGLTITNATIIGSDSAVFQPNADSTTFFQILDADGGTPIFNIDSTNERVGIGTATPATSTALDITSTTGALLVPRMTTTQRDNMTPANGMIIYNTTGAAFNFRENGAWVTGSGLQ